MKVIACTIFTVALSASNAPAEPAWCNSHEANEVYPLRAYLPTNDRGVRTMVDFASDGRGNWYVSGQSSLIGWYRVWCINFSGKESYVEFDVHAEAIDVFYAPPSGTYVFVIVNNEIRMYGTRGNTLPPLYLEHRVIEKGDDDHKFTDLAFDNYTESLSVTDEKTNQVYHYFPFRPHVPKKTAAGNLDGLAIDDETHLYRPLAVKFAAGDLYILQGPEREARLVRWTPFQPNRTYMYDFPVEGRLGFEVSDVSPDYIYYRSGGDSVYKRCSNWSCSDTTLIAGGCGRCHNDNQLVNRGSGALKMDASGRLMIWDFKGNRFVMWEDRALNCSAYSGLPATTAPGKVTWKDKVSYNAEYDVCTMAPTDIVNLHIFYRFGAWAKCGPSRDFEEVNYLPSSLPLSEIHDKQLCIEYFEKLGFTPGESVDYARRAICNLET
ncbi:hypothetical protein FOL47_009256, partial [Perkinsus chesapeaki]